MPWPIWTTASRILLLKLSYYVTQSTAVLVYYLYNLGAVLNLFFRVRSGDIPAIANTRDTHYTVDSIGRVIRVLDCMMLDG